MGKPRYHRGSLWRIRGHVRSGARCCCPAPPRGAGRWTAWSHSEAAAEQEAAETPLEVRIGNRPHGAGPALCGAVSGVPVVDSHRRFGRNISRDPLLTQLLGKEPAAARAAAVARRHKRRGECPVVQEPEFRRRNDLFPGPAGMARRVSRRISFCPRRKATSLSGRHRVLARLQVGIGRSRPAPTEELPAGNGPLHRRQDNVGRPRGGRGACAGWRSI
jgi:hypothetical protein